MSDFIFKIYTPSKMLQPYISRIFVFESKYGMSGSDPGLKAPNGKIKLVIPYKNNMRSTINNVLRSHEEASCFIIGQSMHYAITECDKDYGNLCVEFNPIGAYRFFNFNLSEVVNQIYNTSDLLDRAGKEFRERISEIVDIDGKVSYVEEFLYKQMVQINRYDLITEYAIHKIQSSNGLVNISDLCKEMGYSSRYLLNKFHENVGLSPKEFACVIRFNETYKRIHNNFYRENKINELYYDQSHLIKEFKKFTGFTPGEFINKSNKLGILINE